MNIDYVYFQIKSGTFCRLDLLCIVCRIRKAKSSFMAYNIIKIYLWILTVFKQKYTAVVLKEIILNSMDNKSSSK